MTVDRDRHAAPEEARQFAAQFRQFLEWVHTPGAGGGPTNEVVELVGQRLGSAGRDHPVVVRRLPLFEHVNLQTALNAWTSQDGRDVEIRGVTIPPHFGGLSLQQLVAEVATAPLRLSSPGFVDLPNGPGSTLACLQLALLLVDDPHGSYILLVRGRVEHEQDLTVEVAGLPVQHAQDVLAELDRLRAELNVYRGHVLDVSMTPNGGVDLTFVDPPRLSRDDVVLPPAVLERVERHALGVSEHRDALLAAGQHLKRGLMLYGPPGTGKTHTTRYLIGQMSGATRLILTGRALGAIGAVTAMARELAPTTLVLEDVDLVAEDRSFGPGSSPVLFELLDAMDGAAADADLAFVLTTNRADLLEPALAARPGRVDVAVSIDLPDAEARARLFALYGRGVPFQLADDDVAAVVDRTDGVTASFLKELVRRAVLESLRDDPKLRTVTSAQVTRALDDLLDSTQAVTRTLLGVGTDPAQLPPGGGAAPPARRPQPTGRRAGWMAYRPLP